MNLFKTEYLLGLAAAIFGVITLFASSSVLFGYSDILEKEGNYAPFVLWGNLISGPLYLLAAIGFVYSKKWTFKLLLGILVILGISLIVFIFFLINGENYETETLMALFFRIIVTGILAILALKKNSTNLKMKTILKVFLGLFGIFTFGSAPAQSHLENNYSLHIEVDNFRNSKGVAQFALYNRDGTIPDEKVKRYFKKEIRQIQDGKSSVTFKNLPKGNYAVTVHHDENSNGEIDKIFFYPKEGFGVSNFMEISLSNKPDFSKASFELKEDVAKKIKLIYK